MGLSALLSTQILDSTATGRSVLTGADAASIRTVLGLGTTNAPTFSGAYFRYGGGPVTQVYTDVDGGFYFYNNVLDSSFGFNAQTQRLEIDCPNKIVAVGDVNGNGNGTRLTIDDLNYLVAVDGVLATNQCLLNFLNAYSGNTIECQSTFAIRNGATRRLEVYNTFTNQLNFERGFLECDTNGFTLGHEAVGTGTKRTTRILGASLTGTDAVSALNVVQTWNTTGTPTAFQINITDTASNAASLLANWSVGGNSFFSVAKDGSLNAGRFGVAGFQGLRFTGGALTMSRSSDGGSVITLDTNSNGVTAGSLTASNGRLTLWDSFLSRDATNVVAVRDLGTGTNPCGFRVYNTYTDASNYERARMAWESNQFVIGHEYLGTGAARSVALVGGQTGTQGVVKASTGGVLIGAQLNLSNSSNAAATTSQIVLYTPADGQLRITNSNSTTFDRLFLGLATSAFPMVKRNAAAINFRVGDDTGDCDITAKAATFSGNVTVSAVNIVTDGTTGTKIGTANTQKLGFWNATPLVQPTTAVGSSVVTSPGAGNTIKTDDQFDGYTVSQVVKALRNIGILA